MAFNDRLKEARISKQLTQEQLAEKIGVAKSTITGYEKGNSQPDIEKICRLMEVLSIDANFLWQDEMKPSERESITTSEINHIKKYRKLDTHGKDMVDYVLNAEYTRVEEQENSFPLFHSPEAVVLFMPDLPASAGTGVYLHTDEGEQLTVVANKLTKQADFCLRINGHSMEPAYMDKDIVLVEEQPDVNVGEVGVFIVNGMGYIKKKGTDHLISINPDYDDVYVNETDDIKCRGKVIGVLDPDDIL